MGKSPIDGVSGCPPTSQWQLSLSAPSLSAQGITVLLFWLDLDLALLIGEPHLSIVQPKA